MEFRQAQEVRRIFLIMGSTKGDETGDLFVALQLFQKEAGLELSCFETPDKLMIRHR